MRVAMVNGSRRYDGHTAIFRQFLRGLTVAGIEYRAYSCIDPSRREEYPDDGEILEGWRFPGGGSLEVGLNRLARVFPRKLRAAPGDLLHVNDVYLAPLARYRDNVVVTLADLNHLTTRWRPWPYRLLNRISLRSVRKARGIICISEQVRQEVLRHLPCPPERVRVVPLYADLEFGAPRSARAPPTPAAPWTLLYVAADRPHKNVAFFLEILRAAGNAYRGILVSQPTPKTAQRIRDLGLEDRLSVRAKVDDVRAVYREADVLLFPSLFEGFGLPPLEAMSQGLPVIASNVTSIPEVVGDGGILVEPTDLTAWLSALKRLTDPDVYRAQSLAGLARARGFTVERTGAALQASYEHFLRLAASPTTGRGVVG